MHLSVLVWLNLAIVILKGGMCAWYRADRQPVAAWQVAAAHLAISVYAFVAAACLHVSHGSLP